MQLVTWKVEGKRDEERTLLKYKVWMKVARK